MNITWRKELIPDVLNLLLGAGLFLSPWVLGFFDQAAATWNSWLSGIAIAGLAIAAISTFAEWEEWTALAAGIWVAISPWVMSYSGDHAAAPIHVVAGILIAAAAAVRIWSLDQEYPRVTT